MQDFYLRFSFMNDTIPHFLSSKKPNQHPPKVVPFFSFLLRPWLYHRETCFLIDWLRGGMFYWLNAVQPYSSGGWNYISELQLGWFKKHEWSGWGSQWGFLIQPSMFSNRAFLSFSVAEFNGWNTKVIYFAIYVYTVLEIFMPIQVFRQPWNNDRDSGIPHGSWLPWHVSKVVVQTLCYNMLQQQLNVVYGYKHRESWKQGTVSEIYWI